MRFREPRPPGPAIEWRVPQHPSESERHLIARVLARALEHADGLEFSKGGVADDEEPALVQRDLRGDLVAWIESARRRIATTRRRSCARRVVVYTWKDVDALAACSATPRGCRARQPPLPCTPRAAARLARASSRRSPFAASLDPRICTR